MEYVSLPATPETATPKASPRCASDTNRRGIKVYNIGSGVGPSGSLHNMPEVTLNLPGPRPEDRGVQAVPALPGQGRNPLHHLRPHGQRHLEQRPRDDPRLRRAASSICPAPTARATGPARRYTEPLSHGRVFTKEEIWENYTYFIKQVAPVAEEAGVRIGIHPDDPPAPVLAGVPRCIFGNFEGYKRAMEIANSPNVGICLCCGTWLEGGKAADRQRPRGDDPLLRRRRRSGRSTSATSARRCRTSSRPSWTTATTTCTRS